MGLEKKLSGLRNKISNAIKILSLTALLSCHIEPAPPKPDDVYDYTTTTNTITSQYIDAELGGSIEITDSTSFIQGTELTIPSGALISDATISVGEVNNPPALPAGLNYVGAPINLEPDGINFNNPLTIQIPYRDESLSDAGISDDTNLSLYYYDKSSNLWEEVNAISVNTENNIVTAELNHFSYYAITGFSGTPPEDLGIPQPGDLLYTVGAVWDEGNPQLKDNWMPGHVGIYVGEKQYITGLASDDVKEFEIYNVIEALPKGIQYSYYNVPNVTETFESSLKSFNGGNVYMGAREPKNCTLTSQQRKDIVDYVEDQIGKEYVIGQTFGVLFGMLRGSLVKGPNKFNCVGLAEKAHEIAGVNNGEGLVPWWQEEIGNEIEGSLLAALTPAEQYNATKPAIGTNNSEPTSTPIPTTTPGVTSTPIPESVKIPIISFSGAGTKDYEAQIAVMNEDGSELQEITSDSLEKNYPRLSPSRDKILFELHEKNEDNDDISTLYTINLDGSGLSELVGSSESLQPAWSSKNKIASVKQYGLATIYLYDFSNPSVQEKLTDTSTVESTPFFSPDGDYLIYQSNNKNIVKIDLATKTKEILIAGDDEVSNIEPEFSPDGKKIAFGSNMYEHDNLDIYLYDMNSEDIDRLTDIVSSEYSPHFSKDGSKIFFVSNSDGTSQIYSINLDGSEIKQLTFGPKKHDFGY